jgi:hypothetical protein
MGRNASTLPSHLQAESGRSIRNVTAFALFVIILWLLMLTLLASHVFPHRRQQLENPEALTSGMVCRL